jgi:DNA-3-methyladenine glycosylase II
MNSIEIQNGINHIYNNDKKLAAIINASSPFNLKPKQDYYYSLLRSIIGQQLSTVASSAIKERFFRHFNDRPLPKEIIAISNQKLRNLGLSWSKVKYIKDLSQKILNKEIHFGGLKKMSDEDIIREFTKLNGIGTWTVHMFLIFTLGRLNVLPVNDLGIRKAAKLNYGLRKLPGEERLKKLSRQNHWSPYNSIASWYLWKGIDMKIIV